MLTTFHRLSESWFFKGILLVTALSFMTFFGVGGLDEAVGPGNSVITVGKVDVSAGEFSAAYNKAMKKMEQAARMTGAEMPDEKVLKQQVLAYVLQDEQSKAVVKSAAKDMDITIYPAKLASYVRSIPDFQDVEGSFDRSLFATFLNMTGQSEADFMKELSDSIVENELVSPVIGLVRTPAAVTKNAYAKKFEARDVVLYDIAYDKVKLKEKPSEEEVQSYYDSEKEESYMNPEYRTLSVLYLPFEDIFASIPVTDEEVAQAYEADKTAYVKPETRKIDQMRFNTAEEAQKALKALKKKDFRKVAEEMLSQSEKDTYLGDLPKSDVLFEAAEDLFSAKKNEVVGPVQSEFGWHLFKVLDITAGEVTSVEKARPAIVAAVQRQKAADVLYDKAAEIDDFLGSGKTLEETKDKFSLKSVTLTDIDITGKNRKEADIKLPFAADDFLAAAFALSEGMESPVSEAEDAFYVVRVDKITAPEVKPLSEVKDKVVALWRADKVQEKATAEAEKILQDMREGKKVKGSKTYTSVVNGAADNTFDAQVNSKVFAMPLDEPQMVAGKDGIKVVMVTKIVPANPDADENGVVALQSEETRKLSEEMTAAFLKDFAKGYKVKVNNVLLNRLFGSKTENEE